MLKMVLKVIRNFKKNQQFLPAGTGQTHLNPDTGRTFHCTDAQILAKIHALLEPIDSSFPFPISAG
jgi:hypothetical protein